MTRFVALIALSALCFAADTKLGKPLTAAGRVRQELIDHHIPGRYAVRECDPG